MRSWWWRFTEGRNTPRWAMLLVLAVDEWGDCWLPCKACVRGRRWICGHDEVWWDRPYNPRNPLHWPYVLASHLTGWAVMIEAA